ncbi:MAG: response regulator [Proteobacteria bacterium]|nr:response regulator [Pseudomonadota bacterium]
MLSREQILILNETISLFQKGIAEYCFCLRNNKHNTLFIHNAIRDLEHIEALLECLNKASYFGYMEEVKTYFHQLVEGLSLSSIETLEQSLEASKLLQNCIESNLQENEILEDISAFSLSPKTGAKTKENHQEQRHKEKLVTKSGSGRFVTFNDNDGKAKTAAKKELRMLIVEDEASSRKILSKFLSPYGQTAIATTGNEALTMINEGITVNLPYDIIFLDINLPETDGKEVLKKIRTIEEKSGIFGSSAVKVVMTTGDKSPKSIVNAFSTGCDGYLKKPLNNQEVKATLVDLNLIEK